VDTIPLVGERSLADAVRAVARLPRVRRWCCWRVDGWRNRAGRARSAPYRPAGHQPQHGGQRADAADLVVSDPVQAGVMAVMAVADTAKFNVARLKRRIF